MEGQPPVVYDMPTVTTRKGKGTKRSLNVAMTAELFADLRKAVLQVDLHFERTRIFLERSVATHVGKESRLAVFTNGVNLGVIEGILATLMLPYAFVAAHAWKRRFNLIRVDKEASRQRALQLFPTIRDQLNLKKHHGRAEALLVAAFGKEAMGHAMAIPA